ncbi:hypothetical protein [Bradyrhizobium sp. Ec3.3]|uniref:hypothetical protein n=1 Tax=Bradyrhizobium sp. Ec3.3 TaxID=189753 RepID=UPI00041B5590|nr:hypothetical protein [Bradyrhizobium sp. Ec3.3]
MALTTDDMRFALNDARERHKATVDLITGMDRQALSFLQLYVTLAGAALSGAGVILLSTAAAYPRALGAGLLAFAAPLVIGAIVCIITIWPANISPPGRDPDFWQWADREDVTAEMAYRAYLANLAVKVKQNELLNIRVSNWMLAAKIAGIAAPVLGFFVAAIASQPI